MRRLRTFLAVSLIVNLFAIGTIGGILLIAFNRDEVSGPAIRPPPARPLFVAGAGLPAADRERYVAALRAANHANRALRRDAVENRRLAAGLFEAPVFDREAAGLALARARNDDLLLREQLEKAALDFAATLPQDERMILAAALAHGGILRHPDRHVPLH